MLQLVIAPVFGSAQKIASLAFSKISLNFSSLSRRASSIRLRSVISRIYLIAPLIDFLYQFFVGWFSSHEAPHPFSYKLKPI